MKSLQNPVNLNETDKTENESDPFDLFADTRSPFSLRRLRNFGSRADNNNNNTFEPIWSSQNSLEKITKRDDESKEPQ